MADVSRPVELSLFTDFENHTKFVPGERHEAALTAMLDQVVSWSSALAPLREGGLVGAEAGQS